MWKRSALLLVVFAFAAILSSDAKACSSCHGGDGGYGYGGYARPFLLGNGNLARFRERQLRRRSARAAFFGFPGRAARLNVRANFAAGRAARRTFF